MTPEPFKHGQAVRGIYSQNGETSCRVGVHGVTSITVCMESGQMAPVPWFDVVYANGMRSRWNGAFVESVEMEDA